MGIGFNQTPPRLCRDTASLRRIAFHGQHTVGGLLEANDREFKVRRAAASTPARHLLARPLPPSGYAIVWREERA
jgi:hypothetical protein